MLLPAVSRRRYFAFGISVEGVRQWWYAKRLLAWCLINRLCEFHQIFNLGAVRDKDELIRFRGQKVKGEGHSETKCIMAVAYRPTVPHRRPSKLKLSCFTSSINTDFTYESTMYLVALGRVYFKVSRVLLTNLVIIRNCRFHTPSTYSAISYPAVLTNVKKTHSDIQ